MQAVATAAGKSQCDIEDMGLTVVIKVGTSSLIQAEHNSLSLGNLAKLCEAIRDLESRGDCISCC